MTTTSQLSHMTSSSNLFDVALFLFSCLAAGLSSMSISSLIPELWQFSFIPYKSSNWKYPVRVLPNIWRLGKSEIPNLARMSLIKYYWMLQNVRVTAFIVSELLRENQQPTWRGGGGGVVKLHPLPSPRLGFTSEDRPKKDL